MGYFLRSISRGTASRLAFCVTAAPAVCRAAPCHAAAAAAVQNRRRLSDPYPTAIQEVQPGCHALLDIDTAPPSDIRTTLSFLRLAFSLRDAMLLKAPEMFS